eukprot:TRINITY_DN32517_c0_g1_i1.p1 TRINITY_DN32517_c0_g1~~TRINITY_DN32517_c0_g1_i1.p1  ORF type:complete len:633 (+),score=229.05 TRINITY_DN32517_c0_g1_i1:67-1965(+)
MDEKQWLESLAEISDVAQTEPPRSNIFEFKYKARGMMTALRTKVVDLAKQTPADAQLQQKCAVIHMHIAASMFETEEFAEGYGYLERAEDVLQSLRVGSSYDWDAPFKKDQLLELRSGMLPQQHRDPTSDAAPATGAAMPVYQSAEVLTECFNMAGYCWCSRGDTDKALKALRHSEALYADWDAWARKQGDRGHEGLSVADDGTVSDDASPLQKQRAKMESHFTSTCFYFAQVFGNQTNTEEASKYCHLTLHRQLASKKEFDRVEWATNALGLCHFYLNRNDYGAARYALQSAEKVLEGITDEELLKDEKTNQTKANTHQAFAKWGMYYMKQYKEKQEGVEDPDEPTLPTVPVQDRVSWWTPFNLDVPLPSVPEPIGPPGDGWPRALELYRESRRRFDKALEWFLFDGFCTDYIQIQQDISQLLKYLVHWDRDSADPYGNQIDRHVTIYDQRLKVLGGIPDQISEKHYLNYQRQIWFECAEALSEMAEWRVRQREHRAEIKSGRPVKRSTVNGLLQRGETLFLKFSDSFRNRDGTMPCNLDPDLCNPYITARVHTIRMQSKHLADSAKDEYEQLEKACKDYQELVSWAEQHPDKERVMSNETTRMQVEMSKQMTQLLPGKMVEIKKAFMRLT